MPIDYSLAAVPAAYGLGLAPHVYYLGRMMVSSGFAWSNVSPRQNWDTLANKVPSQIWSRCLRARGAHLNAMETFPLFAAAMLAGSGRIPQEDLNRTAGQFLMARALYTVAYVGIRSEAASYLRTGLWAWSIVLPAMTLIRCARQSET